MTNEELQTSLNFHMKNWKPYALGEMKWTDPLRLQSIIPPESKILEVGCGTHPYKSYFKNIIGIDPIGDAADYNVTLEEFQYPEKFDYAFCMGIINYGSIERIENQINKLSELLTDNGQIIWRQVCSPSGILPVYQWTEYKNYVNASLAGYTVIELEREPNGRIYSRWKKK